MQICSTPIRLYGELPENTDHRTIHAAVCEYVNDNHIERSRIKSAATGIASSAVLHSLLIALDWPAYKTFEPRCREYLFIYTPDSSFTIDSTLAYGADRTQLCIRARHDIPSSQIIPGLSGRSIRLSEKELERVEEQGTDFSISASDRTTHSEVLLGLARFLNHDCNPNAKLIRSSAANWTVKTLRTVAAGEECTVSYGGFFFGPQNEDCKCSTCQSKAG